MFEFFEIVVPMDVNGFAVEPMPAAEPGPDLATLLAQAAAPAPESLVLIESPPPAGGDPFDILAGAGMGDLLASTSPSAVVARDAGDGFVEAAEPVPGFGFRADGGRLAGGPSYTALYDPNSDADGDGYPDKDILVDGSPDGIDKGGDTGGGGGESGGAGGTGDGGSAGGGDGGGAGGGGPAATGDPTNPPVVTMIIEDPANAQQVQTAAQELLQEIARLTAIVESLPDTAQIRMADGTYMSGAEFKALWNRIDFVVTDKSFGPGRAGAYDPATGVATINAGYLLGYDAHPNGLAFMILHEVVHSSPAGRLVDMTMWQAFAARTGSYDPNLYAASPEFAENEEFANYGALALAIALGVSPIFDGSTFAPAHGYEYGNLSH